VFIGIFLLELSISSSYNAALRVQRKLTLVVQDTIFASMRGQDAANLPLEPGAFSAGYGTT